MSLREAIAESLKNYVSVERLQTFWGDLKIYIEGLKPDHTIEDKPLLGKLLITLNPETQQEAKYLVDRTEYTAPATPTFSPATGASGDGSLRVNFSCTTSGVTLRYSLDDGVTWTTATYVDLAQDSDYQAKAYNLKLKAVKNGLESEVATASYTVNRKVAAPTITVDNTNKYAASHVVTITQAAADTIYYTTDGSTPTTSSSTITSGGTITLSSAGTYTVKAMAVKDAWVNSAVASKTSIIVGANKCYIGQAAEVASEANVKALTYSYEQDTLVVSGDIKTCNFGANTEYCWFCIPSTAAKTLTVKSEGFGVTLQDPAGTVVGSYRVWRTANKINDQFKFEFS